MRADYFLKLKAKHCEANSVFAVKVQIFLRLQCFAVKLSVKMWSYGPHENRLVSRESNPLG